MKRVLAGLLVAILVLSSAPSVHAQESVPASPTQTTGETMGPPNPGAVAQPQEHKSAIEQFSEFIGGGGNEALLRIVLWLFDKLVVQLGGWLVNLAQESSGTTLVGQGIIFQLPTSMTVDAEWVRGSYSVFQRVVNAALYGAFVGALIVAGTGGLLGFTGGEAKTVLAITPLIWIANRRSIELVTHLVNLSNTAAAQFADVTQMLPGYEHLNDLQAGAGEGANAILLAIFGIVMAFVRWLTVFGVNALIIVMPLALLAVVWPPTKPYFTVWWRTLAGLVFSQIGIALLLGQAQALSSRFGAGGTGAFLIGSCACLWLATKVPKMLGGLASMPAQAASSATNTIKQYALMSAASYTGNQAAISGMSSPLSANGDTGTTFGPGPTYRSQPLLPRPMMSLPRPHVIDGEGVTVE